MRLVFWLLVLAVLMTVVYAAAQGVNTYFQAWTAVHDAVEMERPSLAQQVLRGGWRAEATGRGEKLRARIVRDLQKNGLPIDPDDVVVSEEEGGVVRVQLRWSQPMFTFRGQQYLLVPISLTRRFDLDVASR